MKTKILQAIDFCITTNFIFSMPFFIVGCFLSLSDQLSLFDFNQELYGELASHLKVTLLYVGISDVIACAYCMVMKQLQYFAFIGFCMMLMIGSTYFYGTMNDVVIDDNLFVFLIYNGCSHLLFGIVADLKKTVSYNKTS